MYTWHMCSRWYTPGLRVVTIFIVNLSHCVTKGCIPAQNKSESSVYSQEVTACLTSVSVANRVPARHFLMGAKRWKHWAPYCHLDLWLIMVLWLGGYEPSSLQSWCHIPYETADSVNINLRNITLAFCSVIMCVFAAFEVTYCTQFIGMFMVCLLARFCLLGCSSSLVITITKVKETFSTAAVFVFYILQNIIVTKLANLFQDPSRYLIWGPCNKWCQFHSHLTHVLFCYSWL